MKRKMYEKNCAASLFVPTNPALNEALQNTEVEGYAYNNATIESMRENSVLHDPHLSGLDKIAAVQAEQLKNMPEVHKAAQRMQELKDIDDMQRGRKR